MQLTTSQRINVMKEVGARLGAETWPLIDLTLKQFGLPVTDDWSGSSESYVLRMIEKASDEKLGELAQHLGYDQQFGTPSSIEPAFWRKGMFRVFISHLATHKKWAASLQESL